MPRTHAARPAAERLGTTVPILRVRSLTASIDFYLDVLGFKLDWKDEGIIASVSRDRCSLLLCEGDQGNPGGWVWIGADDIEPLCAELRAKGATIRQGPTNHPWAHEMQVEDPDGNVLRFGSASKAGESFGPWCDMRGDLWEKRPHGGWERGGQEVTQDAGRAFLARGIAGPVVMLNLLRFREVADYSASPELAPPEPISGAAAYRLYMEHTLEHLRRSGGDVVFLGQGGSVLIGPPGERWDAAMLVRQRSIQDFMAFASNPAYLAGLGHRQAALEDSRLLPLVEGPVG